MIALLAINESIAQTEAELYKKIFGKKNIDLASTVSVPVMIEQRQTGEIKIYLADSSGEHKVDVPVILDILDSYLEADVLSRVISAFQGLKQIKLDRLNEFGIKAIFDNVSLTLQIHIPVSLKKMQTIGLRSKARKGLNPVVNQPAKISAYVNLFGQQHFNWNRDENNRDSTNALLAGAINIGGWVLESEAYYSKNIVETFQVGDSRLVKDFTSQNLRISAGDVTLPARGFQNELSATGLLMATNFSLQPELKIQPSGQKFFTLEHPATVEIIINGLRVKTLRLSAGRYDLRDFPVTNGANDVLIEITDNFGRVSKIEFPLFTDSTLLTKGLYEYGYGIGEVKNQLVTTKDNGQELVFSGFHRLGISDQLTLGFNGQVNFNTNHQLYGGEAHFINMVGTFSTNLAVSYSRDTGQGYATSLGYGLEQPMSQRIWELAATTWSDSFHTPGQEPGEESKGWEYAVGVSQMLGPDLSASFRSRLQKRKTEDHISKNYSLYFRNTLTPDLSWSLGFSWDQSATGFIERGVSAQLSYRFGQNRQHVDYTYNSLEQSHQLLWNRHSSKQIGGMDFGLAVEKKPDTINYTGTTSYKGNRFETRLDHRSVLNSSDTVSDIQNTTLNFASALVFADGTAGLSRPVNDSFAIISPHSSLNESQITIDSHGESTLSQSDFLGPPVVPDLASYRHRTLSLDVLDLPPGQDIGDGLPQLLPVYRSGTIIYIGSDANVILKGKLIITDNHPAALLTGKLIPLNAKSEESKLFFTNRSGNFRTTGLRPGQYQLVLFSYPDKILSIKIPAETQGVHNAGTLYIEDQEKL